MPPFSKMKTEMNTMSSLLEQAMLDEYRSIDENQVWFKSQGISVQVTMPVGRGVFADAHVDGCIVRGQPGLGLCEALANLRGAVLLHYDREADGDADA